MTPYHQRTEHRLRVNWEPARRAAYRNAPIRGGKYQSARRCKRCDRIDDMCGTSRPPCVRYIGSDICVQCAQGNAHVKRVFARDALPSEFPPAPSDAGESK